MSVLLTQIEIRDGLTTHTGNMDTLSYKGGLWLVPTWKPAKTEGMRAPQRLVRPQFIAFQPAASSHPGADYFLSCLVPKSVLDGESKGDGSVVFDVIEDPDIEEPDSEA